MCSSGRVLSKEELRELSLITSREFSGKDKLVFSTDRSRWLACAQEFQPNIKVVDIGKLARRWLMKQSLTADPVVAAAMVGVPPPELEMGKILSRTDAQHAILDETIWTMQMLGGTKAYERDRSFLSLRLLNEVLIQCVNAAQLEAITFIAPDFWLAGKSTAKLRANLEERFGVKSIIEVQVPIFNEVPDSNWGIVVMGGKPRKTFFDVVRSKSELSDYRRQPWYDRLHAWMADKTPDKGSVVKLQPSHSWVYKVQVTKEPSRSELPVIRAEERASAFTWPRRLEKTDPVDEFDCGKDALNSFLKTFAMQNQQANSSVTYVTLKDGKVAGFYSVSFGSISRTEAPKRVGKGLGSYPIPIFLLARLAVDKSFQGKGVGGSLLQDAIARACNLAREAGLRAIVVDAMDDQAKQFYKKYSFEESPLVPMRLFLLMKDAFNTLGL
jgi:GNAT superfamily N-acetyltransferase